MRTEEHTPTFAMDHQPRIPAQPAEAFTSCVWLSSRPGRPPSLADAQAPEGRDQRQAGPLLPCPKCGSKGRVLDGRPTQLAGLAAPHARCPQDVRVVGPSLLSGLPKDRQTLKQSLDLRRRHSAKSSKRVDYGEPTTSAWEHLATATTMYRDMGMTYWLEKAEAEMTN